MGQYIAGSMMLGVIQGIQQGTAAQQEAARRAAEEAAAAEKRRQELLQKAAREARVNWQAQDEANLREFGMIVSTKKVGSGLPPLLAKQAAQATPVFNDPNAIDRSDVTNVAPLILAASSTVAAIPPHPPTVNSPVSLPPPRPVSIAAPSRPLPLLPPARTLPPRERLSPEDIAFLKEKGGDASIDLALSLMKIGPTAASFFQQAKRTLELGSNLTELSTDHLNKLFDIITQAANPNANLGALAEDSDQLFHCFCDNITSLVMKSARSEIASTSDEVSLGGTIQDALETDITVARRQRKLIKIYGAGP